jgi:hypothetical protein
MPAEIWAYFAFDLIIAKQCSILQEEVIACHVLLFIFVTHVP